MYFERNLRAEIFVFMVVLLLNRSHQAVFCQSEPGNVTKLSDDAVVFDEQDAVAVFDHLRQL